MPIARRTLVRAGLVVVGLLVVLWAAGALERRPAAPDGLAAAIVPPAPAATATARRARVPAVDEAVGTVGSRRRVAVAAQVIARVVDLQADVGDRVTAGKPLVVLDDSDVAARFTRAKAQHERVQALVARHAATAEQLEAAEAEFLQARAAMDHTRILVPIDGVVAERHVEPGDLASPGRPLLVVLDPTLLRLEAQVREGLIGHVRVGDRLDVVLPAADAIVPGTVAEVLPAADPQTRTFTVRVNFDPVAGVYPGMFGRLRLPVGTREVVSVPAAAVVRIGQLETVIARDDGGWTRRLVTTGAALPDGAVEILSGLAGGETIGLPAP